MPIRRSRASLVAMVLGAVVATVVAPAAARASGDGPPVRAAGAGTCSTTAEVNRTLRDLQRRVGRRAPALRRGQDLRLRFRACRPGVLVVRVVHMGASRPDTRRRHARVRVVLARASSLFRRPGPRTVTLKTTRPGADLLRRADRDGRRVHVRMSVELRPSPAAPARAWR